MSLKKHEETMPLRINEVLSFEGIEHKLCDLLFPFSWAFYCLSVSQCAC